jgi:hypothetical protein
MNSWTRDQTKDWISQLENRIEDIEYYLLKTTEWCEERGVYNDQAVFACAVMTIVWVSHMRQEPMSRREIFEILEIKDWQTIDDAVFELSPKFQHYDLEELLEIVSEQWY